MLTNIPLRLKRGVVTDEQRSVQGALRLLDELCGVLGLSDLSQSDILDVGCGVKFSQAILNHDLPVRSYTGIEVYDELVDYLREAVDDPRFEYHHIDVQNDLYNPDAPKMTMHTDLGVGDRTFDVICLYSVFTHLNPENYVTMLRLLRRYARPDAQLVFTMVIDEVTDGGFGMMDAFHRAIAEGTVVPPAGQAVQRVVQPFRDLDPEHPLRYALYSREYAYELFEGTGWTPRVLHPPTEHAQHMFVCDPI